MSRFVPGGYDDEDYDDEDFDDEDDYLVYADDPLRKKFAPEPRVLNSVKESEPKPSDRKAFLSPPKSPIRRCLSPSSGALVLDDIRLAVINGNLDYIKSQFQVERGFFIDMVLKCGWTALMYASSCGHHHIVHYCLENKADPNYHKDLFTPLMAACSSSCHEESNVLHCVRYLLKYGALINATDRYLNTCLIYAAKQGRLSVVEELVENHAEINQQDTECWTPLHWAASKGHGSIVRFLVDSNADYTILTRSGQTPADVAFDSEQRAIGDILDRLATTKAKLSEMEIKSLDTDKLKHHILKPVQFKSQEQIRYHGDLEMFLSGLCLSQYIPIFDEHNINFNDLLQIGETDLDKMGIYKLGDKKKILDGITAVHKKSWETSSLTNLTMTKLSCPDVASMMGNISKHLVYIEATVAYIRHKVKQNPEILEYGKDAADIRVVLNETSESLVNSNRLFDELRFFRHDITALSRNAEFQPPDLIRMDDVRALTDANDEKRSVTKILAFATVSVAVFVALKYTGETIESISEKMTEYFYKVTS